MYPQVSAPYLDGEVEVWKHSKLGKGGEDFIFWESKVEKNEEEKQREGWQRKTCRLILV